MLNCGAQKIDDVGGNVPLNTFEAAIMSASNDLFNDLCR